jgi:hypothetical protein
MLLAGCLLLTWPTGALLLLDYYYLLTGKGVRAGWDGLRAGWERVQRSVDATGTSIEGGSGEA